MPKATSPIPEGFHTLTPHLTVIGAVKYLNFLKRAFNAVEVSITPGQAGKLMHMINAAVRKLDDPATLIPILQQLGTRHTGYGVVPSHYATVGAALLKTLEQGLGPAFTPEVKSAWSTVYGFIANVMMKQSAAETASETAQASLPERRSIPRAHSVAAV